MRAFAPSHPPTNASKSWPVLARRSPPSCRQMCSRPCAMRREALSGKLSRPSGTPGAKRSGRERATIRQRFPSRPALRSWPAGAPGRVRLACRRSSTARASSSTPTRAARCWRPRRQGPSTRRHAAAAPWNSTAKPAAGGAATTCSPTPSETWRAPRTALPSTTTRRPSCWPWTRSARAARSSSPAASSWR